MFNLFKGGIKGRFFLTIRQRGENNPAKGGKGGWEMKKGIVFVAFLLGVLVLVGWGCGQNSAAPADTNLDTNVSETSSDNTPEATSDTTGEVPAGWTEYKSDRYGFSFQYPEEWDLRVIERDPFDWNGNRYEMQEIQLREDGSGDYSGVYSFAIASDPSHLTTREWLTSNNRIDEELELSDVIIGDALPAVEIRELTQELTSPDDRAFPGNLAFSNPGRDYIFFPELGQEHGIFEGYGTTPEAFENQVLSTMAFGR